MWELRPKSVLPRLGKLLADAKLTAAQKARIVDIIAVNDDLAAGQTMLDRADRRCRARGEGPRRREPRSSSCRPSGRGCKGARNSPRPSTRLLKDAKTTATGLQLIAAAGATDRVDRGRGGHRERRRLDSTLRKEAVRTLGRLRDREERSRHSVRSSASAQDLAVRQEAIRSLGGLVTGAAEGRASAPKRTRRRSGLLVDQSERGAELKSACAVDALAGIAARHHLAARRAPEGRTCRRNSSPRPGGCSATRRSRASGTARCCSSPRRASSTRRTCPPSPNSRSGPATPRAARQCGTRASPARRSARSATWSAASAGRSGPDLSMIGKKSAREELYESILQPSKAIADQYLQHQVTTTAEVTVTGLARRRHARPRSRSATPTARTPPSAKKEIDGRGAEAQDLDHARGHRRGADRGRTDRPGRVPRNAQDRGADAGQLPHRRAVPGEEHGRPRSTRSSARRRTRSTRRRFFPAGDRTGDHLERDDPPGREGLLRPRRPARRRGEQLRVVHVRRDRIAGRAGRARCCSAPTTGRGCG